VAHALFSLFLPAVGPAGAWLTYFRARAEARPPAPTGTLRGGRDRRQGLQSSGRRCTGSSFGAQWFAR
jgi:hypothetical protein